MPLLICLLICLGMLFDYSGTSVIFFCICSFNLTCVSNKNNKLKMLPEDEGELTPVHTVSWMCLCYIIIDIPEIYRICLLKWQEEQEMDPCTLCPATENHAKVTSTHPPTHPPCHLKFHLHFQTRWIHSTSSQNVSFRSTFKWSPPSVPVSPS